MQKQELEPEKDSSFGNSYNEKTIVAVIAIDFLLLPILLTSEKLDDNLSNALNAICISLPLSACSLIMRVTLGASKQRWQVIYDYLPWWCSRILKFFFFTCLYYGSAAPCLVAVFSMVLNVSRYAGLLLLLSTMVAFTFVTIFNILSTWSFQKRKEAEIPHAQPTKDLGTISRERVSNVKDDIKGSLLP